MHPLRDIVRLSLPLIAAQSAQSLMLVTDTILFGLLGVDALAGGGLGAGIYHFFFIILSGLYMAVAFETAVAVGRGDPSRLAGVVKAGVVLALLITAGLAAVVLVVPRWLADHYTDAAMLEQATAYLQGAIWITPGSIGFLLLRGLASGFAHTGAIMRISLIAALLNFPVSYALMFGLGPLPAWGTFGVAIGTALMLTLASLLLLWECWQHADIRAVLKALRTPRRVRADYGPFGRLGVPILLSHSMEAGVFTAATLMAGTLGSVALAAHNIALQVAALAFNVYIGIAQGQAIRVGQRFGAGDPRQARQYALQGLLLGFLCCLVAAAAFVLAPEPIIRVFTLGEDPEAAADLLRTGAALLLVAALFQAVDGAQVITLASLRAIHMGMTPTLITAVGYWGIAFPIAWWLMPDRGVIGIWSGLGIGLGFTALCLIVLFHWRIGQLIRATPGSADAPR